jgi:hypothetical protein
MKKILLIVCLAFACQTVIAQDDDDKKKKMEDMFGISLGLSYANIVGEHEDNDPVWGGQAGVYLGLWRAQRAMLTTYLLYTMMGAKFSDDAKYRFGYLILPIVFQYMLFNNFYAGAGLQPGLLLSAKYKYNDQDIDIKDNLNTFDLAIPILLTYHLARSFSVGLGVTPGLTKLNESGPNTARNFGGSLRFTYRF